MKAVVFDLDGTLVDSAPDIHAAANALLRELGRPPLSPDRVRSFIGNGIPKLVERVMEASHIPVTPERHAELTGRFTALYADEPAERTRVFPGVSEALDGLAAQGFVLGVCTNKALALTRKVLEGTGLAARFQAVIGGDSLPVRKPDPAPLRETASALGAARLVYVGDSEVDAATARAAGVPFALFTEGYRKAPVSAIPHDVAFSDFARLPAIVQALLGLEAGGTAG